MRVPTVVMLTLTTLATQELIDCAVNNSSSDLAAFSHTPSPSNSFISPAHATIPAIPQPVSCPEMLFNQQFSPDISDSTHPIISAAIGANETTIQPFNSEKFTSDSPPPNQPLLKDTQHNKSLFADGVYNPSPLSHNPLNKPISSWQAFLLDISLLPLSAILFFLLCRHFILSQIVAEAKQRLLDLDNFEEKLAASHAYSEKIIAELEQQLEKVKSTSYQHFYQLNLEVNQQKNSLEHLQSLREEYMANLQKILLETYEAKHRFIQHFQQIPPAQILEAVKPPQQYQLKATDASTLNNSGSSPEKDFLKQGDLLFTKGRYQQAIAYYDKALEVNPQFYDACYNRAVTLGRLHHYEEAVTAYEQAISLKWDNYEAFYNRGNILVKLQRYQEAISSYDKALNINANSAEAWHNRGAVLSKIHRYEEAVASYNQAINLNTNRYESWYNRGNVLGKLQRYEEALVSYDQAITMKNDRAEVWHNRGIALEKLQRYSEALLSYQKALQIKPDNMEIWHNLAEMLEKLHRYEDALLAYDKLLELQQVNFETWLNRGAVLAKLLRYEEALASYNKAIEIQPNNPELWCNCGNALGSLQRYEEALASYERAIKIKPDNYEAWYNRGNLLATLNHHQEALACFSRAFQIQHNLLQAGLSS